jgi:hypothetical protein
MVTQSYPQAPKTPERLFVLCIDIRMDRRIVLLVGERPTKKRKENEVRFL